MSRTYRSKTDGLVLVLMLSVPVAFALTSVRLPPQPHAVSVIVRLLFAATLIFMLWTYVGTWYALDARFLYVRSGPFRWTIALDDIHAVTPSRDMRSGPALSLDRLRIEYGPHRVILISPRDQAGFLHDLEHLRLVSAGRRAAADVSEPC